MYFVVLFISIFIPTFAHAGNSEYLTLAQVAGGGGDGGVASSTIIQQCNVPGACVSLSNAKGGNGGNGGAANYGPKTATHGLTHSKTEIADIKISCEELNRPHDPKPVRSWLKQFLSANGYIKNYQAAAVEIGSLCMSHPDWSLVEAASNWVSKN